MRSIPSLLKIPYIVKIWDPRSFVIIDRYFFTFDPFIPSLLFVQLFPVILFPHHDHTVTLNFISTAV